MRPTDQRGSLHEYIPRSIVTSVLRVGDYDRDTDYRHSRNRTAVVGDVSRDESASWRIGEIMSSMIEYLASLRRYGHTPESIGDVTIGRTVYAAGCFVSPERDAPAGSKAAREGRKMESETRIVLMPMYRTDWVTWNSVGPTPSLLPASHRDGVVYVDAYGQEWFVSGWNERDGVLWLDRVTHPGAHVHDRTGTPYRRMSIDVHWRESFDISMKLASPEVLARING